MSDESGTIDLRKNNLVNSPRIEHGLNTDKKDNHEHQKSRNPENNGHFAISSGPFFLVLFIRVDPCFIRG